MTDSPSARPYRYPMRNADDSEATRLRQLESMADPATQAALDGLGLSAGWRCAELGAGGGSIVRFLADRVGPTGSVTAFDRDTTQLAHVARMANVEVLQGDLGDLTLPPRRYDLVHSRAVLMHLDQPERVVQAALAALRPGGVCLFEEGFGVDRSPAGAPGPYARVMVPIVRRWTFATRLAALLEAEGMVDVRDDVRSAPLVGGTAIAAFWQTTLRSVLELGTSRLDPADLEAMIVLLDDPAFEQPLTTMHAVSARRPV